jgi:hypothetical protein
VEEFLPASGRVADEKPLRLLPRRIQEAQEPPPTLSDPYQAVYPERSGSERHVRVVSQTEVRSNWKWPESWERARKQAKPQRRLDPVQKAYAKRHS